MERRHFELEQGYLNIDAHGLAFTRSGNWQEVANCKEQGEGSSPRMGRLVVGGILVVLGGGGLAVMKGASTGVSLLTFGLVGLGIIRMYSALQHDFAPSFRIPFHKIVQLEYGEGNLRIVFLNAAHKQLDLQKRVPAEAAQFALDRFRASRSIA